VSGWQLAGENTFNFEFGKDFIMEIIMYSYSSFLADIYLVQVMAHPQ